MSFLYPKRVPEAEAMDDHDEVDAYSEAAANPYLESIDREYVEYVVSLGVSRGRALDVGTGPGQIPLALARRLPQMTFVGLDLSLAMLAQARRGSALGRPRWVRAGAPGFPFAPASFDLLLCNSVLHHLADPVPALQEMKRLLKPGGTLVVRDLRRPPHLLMTFNLAWYGRHYQGTMRRLYRDSVRAAYTPREVTAFAAAAGLGTFKVLPRSRTHLVLESHPASGGH